ncbi:hypothetical protein ASPVEDRAFT_308049 [Aspergillus versicolor CBS 583.65]|uniref:Uncharacterized protein n=1 Tax=Aspergillus versicolor CBS 583.65 TaxID=1036611 RepID=A0A1L9PWT8_ASPVE|nr:uncharacterized protein ASPVEDRAFT_308049 [Aspergillus versicolor CBS 583.65]OJJ05902.1 hypothetical protein ASPVEDRAFT_308049 [Aspergillus versicolor CBS 583.65]
MVHCVIIDLLIPDIPGHCLDMLRQAIQYNADTYLMIFRWIETEDKPVFNPKIPVRSCVDFDLLREPLKPRNVGMGEIHALKNPLLNKGF